MKRRIAFTFDQRSFETLEELKRQSRASSLAQVIREACQIRLTLAQQAENGFVDVICRNPKTGQERQLVMP